MGLIRFMLAYSVVAAHFSYFHLPTMVGGEVAVQGFFIISGFYMALILNTQYTSIKSFLINRLLKLYPPYFFVSIIALIIACIQPSDLPNLFDLPQPLIAYIIFTNATMLFQDVSMFIGLNNGHTTFVGHYSNSSPEIWRYLLIPQAWTLGVEISFYALAPWIFKRNFKFIFPIFLASLFVRLSLHTMGKVDDPWSYRFFPTELAFFMLGAMSYTFYNCVEKIGNDKLIQSLGKICATFLLAFMLYFPHISATYEFKKGIFFTILFISIPFIFYTTKNFKFDRFIGELSYPLYLIWGIGFVFSSWIADHTSGFQGNRYYEGMIFLVFCAVGVLFIHKFIEQPVDKIRQKLKAQTRNLI